MTVTTRTSQQATDSTSFVITLPDGSNTSGRRVIVVVGKDGIGTVTWPTSPAFTQIGAGNGTDTHLAVAYRNIDGTEGFDGVDDQITVTGASEQWNAHSYLLTSDEFDSATAPEAAATANATNNGTTDPPSLTPSWGSAQNLWIAASALRFAGNFTAAPTDYTGLLSLNGGDANAPLGTARRVFSAASEDPGTFSHDGGNTAWVATTIAVKPGAAGTNAPAGLAAATGSAAQPVATIAPTAAAATGGGTAIAPAAHIGALTAVAAATGEALAATVETGTGTNAPAGLAAATGTAAPASINIDAPAGLAAAAGTAPQPAVAITVPAGFAAATGTAPAPLGLVGALAGPATATGTVPGASIDLDANAGAATATGLADPGFILTGDPLGPGRPVTIQDPPGITTQDTPGIVVRDPAGIVIQDPAGISIQDPSTVEVS